MFSVIYPYEHPGGPTPGPYTEGEETLDRDRTSIGHGAPHSDSLHAYRTH